MRPHILFTKTSWCLVFILYSIHFSFAQNATNGGEIGYDQNLLIGIYPDTIQNIISPSGGDVALPLEYIWYQGASTLTFPNDWSIASGVHDQSYYVPPILSEDTYYVRGARRQGYTEYQAGSNIVAINVTASDLISGGTIGYNQTIDPGEIPDTIYSIAPAMGVDSNLVIEYLWTSGNSQIFSPLWWNNPPGSNRQSYYVAPPLYTTTYFCRQARIKGQLTYSVCSNLISININPTPPVNIEILETSTPKIYPNPVTNYLQIEFKENSFSNWLVEIFDLKGSLQKSIELENVRDIQTINLHNLAKGIYLIQLTDLENNKVERFKILKE